MLLVNKEIVMKIRRLFYILLVLVFLAGCTTERAALTSEQNGQTQNNAGAELVIEDSATDQDFTSREATSSENHEAVISAVSASDITQKEIEGILFMREEEKLARDVYLTLGEIWGMNIFNNIAKSEETHMDAVLTLIEKFGLEDPAKNKAIGEYSNSDLRILYDELIKQGSISLADALLVGGAVEEIDIIDLQKNLDLTENRAILEVYENLLNASSNHLNSFSSTYQRQTGEEYEPQYLSLEEFQELISSNGNPSSGKNEGGIGGRQGKGRKDS
jgi:hypothetical protein